MIVRFAAALLAVLLSANASAGASMLSSVQVHLGIADLDAILDGSKAVPLIEPTLEIEPAFSGDIERYMLRVPEGVDGITLVLEAEFGSPADMGVLDVNGIGGEFSAVTYSAGFTSGTIIPVRLEPGDNHIRFGARNQFGGKTELYTLLVARGAERSTEAGLAALILSRGALEPSFDSEVLSYRTQVAGDSVALSAQTGPGGSAAVQGIGPDGRLLETKGLAVLGLGAGENAIIVSVTGADGSAARHYLIRAEASDMVREVSAGDVVTMPDDCDGTVGCGGTLNGAEGRFACGQGTAESNAEGGGSAADVTCSIGLAVEGGVTKVGSVVGWYFWGFPE